MDDSTISKNDLTQQLKIYNDMDRVTYHNKDLDFAFGLSMTSKTSHVTKVSIMKT